MWEIAVGCRMLVLYKFVCDKEFCVLQIHWWVELWKIMNRFFWDPLRVIKCPSPAGNQQIAKTSCTFEIWRIESELPSFCFLSSWKPSMMILLQYSIELMSALRRKSTALPRTEGRNVKLSWNCFLCMSCHILLVTSLSSDTRPQPNKNLDCTRYLENSILTVAFSISLQQTLNDDPLAILCWVNVSSRRRRTPHRTPWNRRNVKLSWGFFQCASCHILLISSCLSDSARPPFLELWKNQEEDRRHQNGWYLPHEEKQQSDKNTTK